MKCPNNSKVYEDHEMECVDLHQEETKEGLNNHFKYWCKHCRMIVERVEKEGKEVKK